MRKKKLIAFADGIRLHNKMARINGWTTFTDDQLATLADFCKSTNSKFNRERWLDYIAGKCGPNGGSR